jgi:hypothetical protein
LLLGSGVEVVVLDDPGSSMCWLDAWYRGEARGSVLRCWSGMIVLWNGCSGIWRGDTVGAPFGGHDLCKCKSGSGASLGAPRSHV